ncbi:MAG: hypothetical protein M3Q70_01420 [bacterium]|nr:hypothetical protein [bacterium]
MKSKKNNHKPALGRAPIFRYYSGSTPQSDKPLERKSQRKAKKGRTFLTNISLQSLPMILLGIFVAGVFFFNLYVNDSPTIKYSSKDTLIKNENTYREGIVKSLNQSLANKTKLTINSARVENDIKTIFPEIAVVNLSVPLIGNQPVVGVQFARPVFVAKARNGDFIVGQNGKVLDSTRSFGSELMTVTDASGIDYQLGQRVFIPQDIDFIEYIVSEVSAQSLEVSEFKVGISPRDILIRIGNEPYLIKLNFEHDPRSQLGSLWAVRQQLTKEGKTPAEYVDVRLGDRVFVK